jgi:hypothetical protein
MAADGPLVVVIGIGGLRPGASGRNIPANLTVIREGTGVFYATQGDDKCAFDLWSRRRSRQPMIYTARPRVPHPAGPALGIGQFCRASTNIVENTELGTK